MYKHRYNGHFPCKLGLAVSRKPFNSQSLFLFSIIGGTGKNSPLRMHVDLHWFDVSERVTYKLVTMVHNCLHAKAPRYLTNYCTPVSADIASRRHLHSASRRHLLVLRHNLSAWNSVWRTPWTVASCGQFQTVT